MDKYPFAIHRQAFVLVAKQYWPYSDVNICSSNITPKNIIEGIYVYEGTPCILSHSEWHRLTDTFWLSYGLLKSRRWFYFKEKYFFSERKTIVLFDENYLSKVEKMKEYCKVRKIKYLVTTSHLAWHFNNEKTALAFYLAFLY